MTYRGLDVLDQTAHNMREAIAQAFGRKGNDLPNPMGKRTWDDTAAVPFPRRSFLWTCKTRAQCVALRAFLDARRGRLNPFWTPTFVWDIELAGDDVGSVSLQVVRSGFQQFQWGYPHRQDIAVFIRGQAAPLLRRVIDATTAGGVDTLTLDTLLGVAAPAATTRICFLTLCRLADDMTPIVWHSTDCCEATITFQELPKEVP